MAYGPRMTKPIPEGIRTLTPQLSMDGCAEAIEFYKKAFGAEEIHRAPDPSGKKIWHAQLKIGDSMLFLNDTFPEMGGAASKASIWVYSDNVDKAFKRAVDAGAQVKMPLADMFWGDRTGQVTDKWGNSWNFAQHMRDVSPDEMKRATEELGKKK
jgi:PhnB protein